MEESQGFSPRVREVLKCLGGSRLEYMHSFKMGRTYLTLAGGGGASFTLPGNRSQGRVSEDPPRPMPRPSVCMEIEDITEDGKAIRRKFWRPYLDIFKLASEIAFCGNLATGNFRTTA